MTKRFLVESDTTGRRRYVTVEVTSPASMRGGGATPPAAGEETDDVTEETDDVTEETDDDDQ